ncbi:hypothetical protein [Euzebya sp.]|uniref:hypothetical protein n=1 Tax=Euzebya sp. TaxID=1971409 RepID=UPI003513D5F0
MKDDDAIESKQAELDAAEDVISRLQLQEELRKLSAPSLEAVEEDFVVHAKSWADESGISAEAFAAEGVPTAVLRRAGFQVGGGRGGRRQRRSASGTRRSSGTRVTTEEVIESIPSTAFTVKQLREISGASPAVVRKAISAEQEAGRLSDLGPDPDHSGPGRAPTLYKRA